MNLAIKEIKEYLKDNKITQKELASRLDYSEMYVSLVLNGKKQPSFRFAQAVAEEIGVEESGWRKNEDGSETL